MNRVALAANELTAAALARAGLRRHHYAVLLTLTEAGPASQAELGRRLAIDRKDMAAAAAELERDGLIARERDPGDRRRNVVTVTAAGSAALAEADAAVDAAQEQLLAPLDAQGRAALVTLASRLLERPSA